MEHKPMALRCGRLLRPDGRFAQNETVLVQGGKITAVGPHIDVPEGFETLDLSGAWAVSYTHLIPLSSKAT